MRKLSPPQLLVIVFVLLILTGTFLLCLPQASTGNPMSVTDALFTSTSAACVTGLIVKDTPNDFTIFGQIVILVLIQVGGIGIMTFSSFIALLLGRKIGLFSSLSLKEDLNVDALGEIRQILVSVVFITVWLELLGAFFLSFRFFYLANEMDLSYSPFYLGVFHSVSAFCNAGFSLFSNSLESFSDDLVINLTIMFLIIAGGIGFFVILDILENKLNPRLFMKKSEKGMSFGEKKKLSLLGIRSLRKSGNLTLQTRIVLITTLLLIAAGAVIIFMTEMVHSPIFYRFSNTKQILISLFASVTPRTAGFNTYPVSQFSNPTLFLMIALMFIGASPGSTGGGIKTTSLALLFMATKATVTNENEIIAFRKRIPWNLVNKVLALIMISLCVIFVTTFILTLTERQPFLTLLFEATSAFGTVGLSYGITPELSTLGKWIISFTMLIGRLGPLTLAFSFSRQKQKVKLTYPDEGMMIG